MRDAASVSMESELHREVLYWRQLLGRVAGDLEHIAGRETDRGRARALSARAMRTQSQASLTIHHAGRARAWLRAASGKARPRTASGRLPRGGVHRWGNLARPPRAARLRPSGARIGPRSSARTSSPTSATCPSIRSRLGTSPSCSFACGIDGHLARIGREYAAFFNHARPHQGIVQRIPDGARTRILTSSGIQPVLAFSTTQPPLTGPTSTCQR